MNRHGRILRLLLTSAGIKNTSIHGALVDLLGKPIADTNALCIPTAQYGHPQVSPDGAWRFISGSLVPGPPPVPSRVSFEVRWAGHGATSDLHDTTFGFSGHYVTGPATISFIASNDTSSVTYRSDVTGQSNPGPPGVGNETNGVFFH